jgi:hypothetical protein
MVLDGNMKKRALDWLHISSFLASLILTIFLLQVKVNQHKDEDLRNNLGSFEDMKLHFGDILEQQYIPAYFNTESEHLSSIFNLDSEFNGINRVRYKFLPEIVFIYMDDGELFAYYDRRKDVLTLVGSPLFLKKMKGS